MASAKITVTANGPLRVEGDFHLVDQQGRPFGLGGRMLISLCRCGASENKPFCDGSHRRISFQAPSEAKDLPAAG